MLQTIHGNTAITYPDLPPTRFQAPTQVGSLADLAYGTRRERQPQETTVLDFPSARAARTDPELELRRREEPSPEDKLYAELQSYLSLPRGWDGYDGVPPSFDAVMDAFAFLFTRPEDIPLPYPQIGPDGEVGLYWRTEEVFAEVGFYGDGEYAYYASYSPAGGEEVEHGQEAYSLEAGGWPERLLQVLNKIAK